jgi:FKBP-type peptidyl-prolyl cis-trans isomerase (trigger factor)
MNMKIHVSIPVTLSDEEVNVIFRQHLTDLRAGQWIENGKIREEAHTSHTFDTDSDDQSLARYRLLDAIITLEKLLYPKKKR